MTISTLTNSLYFEAIELELKRQLEEGCVGYINNKWCHPNNITVKCVHSDDNIELLVISLRPFYLPREFTKITVFTTYIPPSADKKAATDILQHAIDTQQSASPDSVIIVTGDFNHCADVSLVGFEQFVKCVTRGDSIIDLFYCNIKNSYKCINKAPLGASDHNMLLLCPIYKPVVRSVKPVKKCVRVWNERACEELRGCFECTDWGVFIENNESVDDLVDCVCEYIKFCEDNVCERKEVVCYANNKPWVGKELKSLLNKKKYYFSKGETSNLKEVQKELKGELKRSKEKFKQKIEQLFLSNNMKDTWTGLKTVVGLSNKKTDIPTDIDINELNKFYCRFDSIDNSGPVAELKIDIEGSLVDENKIDISVEDTKTVFSKLSSGKAPGPDGLKPKTLKVCAEELSYIFTYIFNLSIFSTSIPVCWKTSSVIPIPKKNKVSSMNDLRPVALTSVAMKCLERLALQHINVIFRANSDPFQFAYQPKRGVEDALATFTNNIYSHLDLKGSYCRVLFADFSSAFNTMQPHVLVSKMLGLKINKFIIAWVLEFLTERRQFVKIGTTLSNVINTNTGAPQGCVLSPILFTIYTNDCRSSNPANTPLIKFADDTSLLGLILNDDETYYRQEIDSFVSWCDRHFLELNVGKTKELIVDFRKKKTTHEPIVIKEEIVQTVSTYKYLGVTVDDCLKWTDHLKLLKNKVHQRMYFLSKLVCFNIDRTLCTLFYRSCIESIVTFCISVWGGNISVADKQGVNRIIKRASRVTDGIGNFDSLLDRCCLQRILKISKDDSHPLSRHVHISERSGRMLSLRSKSERHRRSFLPTAIRSYNKTLTR